MYGKQVYKGLMGRTVLARDDASDNLNEQNSNSLSIETASRPYDQDELNQLFELEPHGVCKTIERLDLPSNVDEKYKKCLIPRDHPSLVGLTRREDIYKVRKKRKSVTDCDTDEGGQEVQGEMQAAGSRPKRRRSDSTCVTGGDERPAQSTVKVL